MFERNNIYSFVYSRTITSNNEKYYVLKYNNSETLPEYEDAVWFFVVSPYPFQETWGLPELKDRVIPCIVTGFKKIKGGKYSEFPLLRQDINSILKNYYQEGYRYDDFTVIKKEEGDTKRYYAKDRFGFEHHLPTYGVEYPHNQPISLRVLEIENRNLLFEPPHLERLPRHFTIGEVYSFKVLMKKQTAGHRRFVCVSDNIMGAVHRCPIADDSKINIGDSIDMVVTGFAEQGWLQLQIPQDATSTEAENIVTETVAIEQALQDEVTNALVYKENIRIAYKNYMVRQGYKEYTPAGNPSTVYSYSNAVENVRQSENLSWNELVEQIENLVALYGPGGSKEEEGRKSKSTVINALRAFMNFVSQEPDVRFYHTEPKKTIRTSTEKSQSLLSPRTSFEEFLKSEGYKEYTPAGNPSTVYSYSNAVENVRQSENLGWNELVEQIENLVALYGPGGSKEEEGRKSKSTVINALKAFGRFVKQRDK